MTGLRVLGRIRLSRTTDHSTSVERQREIIQQWANANDHTIIGWAEDLDISGSLDPFDTPELGDWLNHRADQFDILCAWKLDRIARRSIPMHRLFGWCQDHGKTLVCVADNLDLSSWVGRLVASVIAGVAEGELEAIRQRSQASQRKIRELGRWHGGHVPYGYKPEQTPDGYRLVIDTEAKPVLDEIVRRFLDGESVESIAKGLTAPRPQDLALTRRGLPPTGKPWRSTSIFDMLKSPVLLGHTVHKGVTVRDPEGMPVLKGPALVDEATYELIQEELKRRCFSPVRTEGVSPVLGVAKCLKDHQLYLKCQTTKGKEYRYYTCPKCRFSVPCDTVEELLEQTFLEAKGDEKEKAQVYLEGSPAGIALKTARRAVDELTALLSTTTSDTVRSSVLEQLKALDSRISGLEDQPATESGWITQEGDKTYRELWETYTPEERRQMLIRSGVWLRIHKAPRTESLTVELFSP